MFLSFWTHYHTLVHISTYTVTGQEAQCHTPVLYTVTGQETQCHTLVHISTYTVTGQETQYYTSVHTLSQVKKHSATHQYYTLSHAQKHSITYQHMHYHRSRNTPRNTMPHINIIVTPKVTQCHTLNII